MWNLSLNWLTNAVGQQEQHEYLLSNYVNHTLVAIHWQANDSDGNDCMQTTCRQR